MFNTLSKISTHFGLHKKDASSSSSSSSNSTSPSAKLRESSQCQSTEVGTVIFQTQTRAKYIVVSKDDFCKIFTELNTHNIGFLPETPPLALISITGAAKSELSANLGKQFRRALVSAAQKASAWIVSGGTNVGVMQFVGAAKSKMSMQELPVIGVVPYNNVHNKEQLTRPAHLVAPVAYDETGPLVSGTAPLNPYHSHFILIESEQKEWGQEIAARTDFESHLSEKYNIPLCLIVVNGGKNTFKTILMGIRRGFSVLVYEGTGRAADSIARQIRKKKGLPYEHLEDVEESWNRQENEMQEIVDSGLVQLYSPEVGPLDEEILKSILKSQCKFTNANAWFENKLKLAVDWNRVSVVEYLLEESTQGSVIAGGLKGDEFTKSMNKFLQFTLEREKSDIFRFLAIEKGLKKNGIDMISLYCSTFDIIAVKIFPNVLYRGHSTPQAGSIVKKHRKELSHEDIGKLQSVFKSLPAFKTYNIDFLRENKGKAGNQDKKDSNIYTDVLIWAILSGKLELSQVVWEKVNDPLHAALLSAGLCRKLAVWLRSEQEKFSAASQWFERVATKLLEKLSYEDAKKLLGTKDSFGSNPLKIAVQTDCREFMVQSHVQVRLDEKLYSNKQGRMPPSTSAWWIAACIFLPFLLLLHNPFHFDETPSHFTGEEPKVEKYPRTIWGRILCFYHIPYTRFWFSTVCYVAYLVLLSVVMVTTVQSEYSVTAAEGVLWAWMFAYLVEELSQLKRGEGEYFSHHSNQMDVVIIFLQIFYIGFAIAADYHQDLVYLKVSTYFLTVATIISFLRLLDVFTISKELGPLYFVLQKILGDVLNWTFVFLLFAVGFQVSFMALNNLLRVILKYDCAVMWY